jgi:hypothetical protein
MDASTLLIAWVPAIEPQEFYVRAATGKDRRRTAARAAKT